MNNRELVGSIRDAILTNSGDLTGLLQSYVKTVGDRSGGGYVINSSDLYTRGVSAMLTAIDMFGQLKNQRGDISMVTDWMFKMKKRQNDGTTGMFNDPISEINKLGSNNYDGVVLNDPLLQIATALGGSDNAFNMTNEEKEELANRMGIYLQQNIVFL